MSFKVGTRFPAAQGILTGHVILRMLFWSATREGERERGREGEREKENEGVTERGSEKESEGVRERRSEGARERGSVLWRNVSCLSSRLFCYADT